MTAMNTATLERQSTYTLKSVEDDILTFAQDKHSDIKVRLLPQKQADGKLVLFEPWQKDPTGKSARLHTERGYEWVFEPPLLMNYHLSEDGYPTDAEELMRRFFDIMAGAEFKNYPREIFR
jgi:hypothetical protein